jgi:hypothetical protein
MLQAGGRETESAEAPRALVTTVADKDAYFVAMTNAYRNGHALAIQWLERAYERKASDFNTVVGEPLFENLKDDPRFKAFRRKINLATYQLHEAPTR